MLTTNSASVFSSSLERLFAVSSKEMSDRLTLAEIRLHGSGKAAHLVERYYEPEFAEYAEDKFIYEIHYAEEVIRAWN